MVPNKFNMIDLDGLDIIESQGVIVPGLYNKLVESIALCRYQCIYNWRFNSVTIPPTYVELDSKVDGVWINDGIVVSQDDTIHIYSIEPEPIVPVIEPLNVAENGVYTAETGTDGFNPVTVDVAVGLSVAVCELFRHIMFSNSATDKVQRKDRWFQRNTNEPVLFLSSAHLQNGSIAYSGYAGISFSANGITGTNSSYGDLVALTQKTTPNGTSYYVQAMNGMYPPNVDSGKVHFMYASSNYEFLCVPNTANLLVDAGTLDFIGNQNLISLMYTLIDAMYQEYYS